MNKLLTHNLILIISVVLICFACSAEAPIANGNVTEDLTQQNVELIEEAIEEIIATEAQEARLGWYLRFYKCR